MTFPIWFNAGNARQLPKVEKPKEYRECVESAQFMRSAHMKVLDDWRDDILRDGGARSGKTHGGTE